MNICKLRHNSDLNIHTTLIDKKKKKKKEHFNHVVYSWMETYPNL